MITINGKPVSVNALYRGRRFLTQAGKDNKQYNSILIKNQWKKKPLEGDVGVEINFYYTDNRKRDIDSPIKSILDCLTGICFKDDSQIVELLVKKYKGVKDCSEINVYELD